MFLDNNYNPIKEVANTFFEQLSSVFLKGEVDAPAVELPNLFSAVSVPHSQN